LYELLRGMTTTRVIVFVIWVEYEKTKDALSRANKKLVRVAAALATEEVDEEVVNNLAAEFEENARV